MSLYPLGLQSWKHNFAKAAAAAVRRLFSPVSASKPAIFLQGEERLLGPYAGFGSGRSELGISDHVASSGRKFQSLKTILRIYAAPDAQFSSPSSIGGFASTASYNRPCRPVYFKRAFLQAYASHLELRANLCFQPAPHSEV